MTGLRSLGKAVDTANENQEANTKQFLVAFGKLSRKVSDLQAHIATEEFQRKLASVQTELQNTERALAPAPKARLLFSFFPYDAGVLGSKPLKPTTDVTLPMSLDRTVHVEFVVLNPTETEAKDGRYAIIICDICKYAKEPQGFTKLDGRSETERYFSSVKFQHWRSLHWLAWTCWCLRT